MFEYMTVQEAAQKWNISMADYRKAKSEMEMTDFEKYSYH